MTEQEMIPTIRCRYRPLHASGRRESWAKTVTGVDNGKVNGYAFQGEFLQRNAEVDLPLGQLVVGRYPAGSVRHASQEWFLARVGSDGLQYLTDPDAIQYPDSWSSDHEDAWGWSGLDFLSFRDLVADQLATGASPDLGDLRQRRMALLDELDAIDAQIARLESERPSVAAPLQATPSTASEPGM